MRSASLYRVSGYSLIAAALLWTASFLLQPHGPTNTVADLVALVGPRWIAASLIGIVGSVLGIAGIMGMYRHFVGGDQEGWVLLALGAGVTGGVLVIAAMCFSGVALPISVAMAHGARLVTPEPAQAALAVSVSGLGIVGGTLLWLSLIPLGYGMLRDRVWPRTVAWGAIAIGVIEVIASFLFMRDEMVSLLFSIVGFAFLAMVGNTLARIPRAVAQAPQYEQPGAPV